MKRTLISLILPLSLCICALYSFARPTLGVIYDENGYFLSDCNEIKAGDRLITPDGCMYSILENNGQFYARLNEILPELTIEDISARLYRYPVVGIYGINCCIDNVLEGFAQYNCVTLRDNGNISSEDAVFRLSRLGGAAIFGVKRTSGKEIRLTVLRTVSQKDAMPIVRFALQKGNIDCVLIKDPLPGQKVMQPRLIFEIGEDVSAEQTVNASKDISHALFAQAMRPDGSEQAGVYIAPIAITVIFICFLRSFFRPKRANKKYINKKYTNNI